MSDANRLLFSSHSPDRHRSNLHIRHIYVGCSLALGLDLGTGTFALSHDDHWSVRTLGVFLLIAARNPYAHTSLIWFTVWSSVVHAVIMGVRAVSDPAERGHLLGDVPALILVAVVLAALTPRGLHKLESGGHTVPA